MKSRKLWAAIIASLITTIGGHYGLDQTILDGVISIATTYIIGQGAVDTANAFRTQPAEWKDTKTLVSGIEHDLDKLKKLIPKQTISQQ